jgi:hypothetical protein
VENAYKNLLKKLKRRNETRPESIRKPRHKKGGFEVSTAILQNIQIFWNVMSLEQSVWSMWWRK